MTTLLADIEQFLTANGMAPTTLGDNALGDRHFVRQLRKGRRVWPETENRVRHFMANYSPPVATSPGKCGDVTAQAVSA